MTLERTAREYTIGVFEPSRDTEAVIALWQLAFPEYGDASRPHRNPRLSISNKLAVQPELFFVAHINEELAGTIMAGYDGHRGWLYSLAVMPALRGRGIGRGLVVHAEAALAALGCPKLNLQIMSARPELIAFYEALGYREDPVVSLGKRLGDR